MRLYVSFDDTDHIDAERGTGKLARWFVERLPKGFSLWGVVRHQLLVHADIPYTSHNSCACVIVDVSRAFDAQAVVDIAARHIADHFIEGSDPGLCVATGDIDMRPLIGFGRRAATEVVTQSEAQRLARRAGVHLSSHGGTGDGVIGALAGVGLSASGWSGRFLEYHTPLRDFPRIIPIQEAEAAGMLVVPVDRNEQMPRPTDSLDTHDWLRPRLWGGQAVVPARRLDEHTWSAIGKGDSASGPAAETT